jgi:hypothetical protein
VSDQVWTKAGREKFTGTSLEACLNTAAAATPSASLRRGVLVWRTPSGRTYTSTSTVYPVWLPCREWPLPGGPPSYALAVQCVRWGRCRW